MFTIQQIVEMTNGKLLQGDHKRQVKSIHFDSRKIDHDSCFVALTTGARDGHQFLQVAQEAGATAALISDSAVDRENLSKLSLILVQDTEEAFQKLASEYRKRLQIPIIAITGSNGKTTTKDMIAHLLSTKRNVFKTQGNLNNHLGAPLSLLQITPEHQAAVLELGMNHPGEIDFLANIVKPTLSVITNIGDAHIEFFGSKQGIAEAKGELLPHTDPSGFVLLNKDDQLVCSQAYRYSGEVNYYSIKDEADVYASDITFSDQGTSFRLHIKDQSATCFIPMFGHHNVSNVLPGVFIAYKFGFSLETIVASLLSLTISDMRFQMTKGPNQSLLINDAYNASPTSMKASIRTFGHIYPQRDKVLVLGDIYELGKDSEELHRTVGQFIQEANATNPSSFSVITVGNMSKFISEECHGTHYPTKAEAIDALKPYLTDQYALLFKASRGMKLEEIIKELVHE